MRIIFDNNIWISVLIGKRLSALKPVFLERKAEVYICDQLEREFLDVAHRPKILKYVSEEHIQRVHRLMITCCRREAASGETDYRIRDPKDAYLLALADAVHADFLISGDSDLTELKRFKHTQIIDFSTALTLLK